MKKAFVFCIGGTGLRVMKSAIMLLASGVKTNGYTIVPVLVDPHEGLDEQKNLHTLIEKYQSVYNSTISDSGTVLNPLDGFFHGEVKTLGQLNNDQNDSYRLHGKNELFRTYINQAQFSTEDINNHLISTLFSTKSLNSSLDVGFKGNPNVGTVVLGDMVEGSMWFNAFKQQCEAGDKIFIISSIFGGTGASGFPLLEKKIKNSADCPAVQQALMGAVTVLPYYGLKDPKNNNSDIDSANFYTKTKSALTYYDGKIKSDYLYYVGEQSLRAVYENNEEEQKDQANFIELVAATALFDFLEREKPQTPMYLTRSINEDKGSLDLSSLGKGYKELVKRIGDYMLLERLVEKLPGEKFFPLKIDRGFNSEFYKSQIYGQLRTFSNEFKDWYIELANNDRAFAPLNYNAQKNLSELYAKSSLNAMTETYYILEMVKESNKAEDNAHGNKLRYFLDFAYKAINNYTKEIM